MAGTSDMPPLWPGQADTESESGSSYAGSGSDGEVEHGRYPSYIASRSSEPCRYRTEQFHDQECSRYFDCPSHLVERILSDAERGEVAEQPPRREVEEDRGVEESSRRASDGSESSESAHARPPTSPAALLHLPLRTTSLPRSSSHARSSDEVSEEQRPPAQPTLSRGSTSDESSQGVEPSRPAILLNQPPLEASPGQPSPAPSRPSAGPSRVRPPPRPGQSQNTVVAPPSPQHYRYDAISSPRRPQNPERRAPPDIVLPRWQPDAEVTFCPICHAQFSIFVRKHHCRKCGRVVCNSCSPHRITIPYQYIVRQPGQARMSQLYSYPSFSEGTAEFRGGGERVRLCNPCVPDPNTTPPQPIGSPNQNQFSPRSHYRSQSSVSGNFQGSFGSLQGTDPSRGRSSTLNVSAASSSRNLNPYAGNTEGRILSGTPPAQLHYTPYRSVSNYSAGASSSSTRPVPSVPPLPAPIPEEDECPVCHRELPPRTLPNVEALREAHINICITAHSTYSGTPGASSGEVGPDGTTPPPLSARRTGMFPYKATEKDCVDSAECTICLEEFEVGVQMARLECLCRFHRQCISAWFVNHPGRCPVHQHDSFGF